LCKAKAGQFQRQVKYFCDKKRPSFYGFRIGHLKRPDLRRPHFVEVAPQLPDFEVRLLELALVPAHLALQLHVVRLQRRDLEPRLCQIKKNIFIPQNGEKMAFGIKLLF
jgi:hypothetical protein